MWETDRQEGGTGRGSAAGWLFIVAFSASIAGYGWLVYRIIPDAPRRWDFGQLPDTPAESIYSTEEPKGSSHPPRQLLRLPEARPDSSNSPGAAGSR